MNLCAALVKLAANPFSPESFERGSSGVADVFKPMQAPAGATGASGGSSGDSVRVHLRPDQQAFYGGAAPAFKKMPYENEQQLQSAYGADYGKYRQAISGSFGVSDPKRLTDIMNVMHGESGGSGNAARGDAGGQSQGLFQINQKAHPEYRYDPSDWQGNINEAAKLYHQGGLTPWKTTTLRKGIQF